MAKRLLGLLSIFVLGSSLLQGCGGAAKSGNTSTTPGTGAESQPSK